MKTAVLPRFQVGASASALAPTTARRPRPSTALSLLARAVLVQVILAGCAEPNQDGYSREDGVASRPDASSPLHLRLEIDPVVRASEAVPMRLVLENRGDEPVDVELTGRPPAFDFRVLTGTGKEVWRRLDGVAISLILQPVTLEPGETLDFIHRWDQQDQVGRPVPPGSYRAQAILPVVEPHDGWRTELVEFRIIP